MKNQKIKRRKRKVNKVIEFPRFVYEELFMHIFWEFFTACYCDEHEVSKMFDENREYHNETFECHEYDWNDEEYGNDVLEHPCFYHKPSGFKMSWYKYPMRSPEANMELTPEEFASILYDCRESIYRDNGGIICTYDIGNTKWWRKK